MIRPRIPSNRAKQQLRAMQILFIGFAGGVIMLIGISIFVNEARMPSAPGLNQHHTVIMTILAIASLICLLTAKRKFQQGTSDAKNSIMPLSDKLGIYQKSLIISMALCEMPTVVSVILFMLSGNFGFLVFGAVLLGFMLSGVPTKKRVVDQLELNAQEQQELE